MITVICPVYNEAAYIKSVLDFFLEALPVEKELIVIDGNSADETADIIKKYQLQHNNIHLLYNPDRYVPYALNAAIRAAKGDIIIRLDAHTDYDTNYFTTIISTFAETGADIVGGPMRIAPGNYIQNAIGYVTSTSFGIGNSSFHFDDFKGFTDSVYLGAWKKEVFETTGLFDTNFKRNQDDEFHYRAKSYGLTIYQNPEIKLYYHPRKNLSLLFKQYYQYGLYKPMVLKKIKSGISIRHIVPSLFVLYLLSLPALIIAQFFYGIIPLALYIFLSLALAVSSEKRLKEISIIPIVYSTIHLAYGWGFIRGFWFKGLLQKSAGLSANYSNELIAEERSSEISSINCQNN